MDIVQDSFESLAKEFKVDAQGKVLSTAMLRLILDIPDGVARHVGMPAAPVIPRS